MGEVIIVAAIIVFILFPMISAVIERYLINIKLQIIKDAVDITNISTYVSIDPEYLGRNLVIHDQSEVWEIYSKLLSSNLNLKEDLSPEDNSVAEEKVKVESIIIYTGDNPEKCPLGTDIRRPGVHSLITVPVKPSLYSQIILNLMGKNSIELRIHVDSEVPVNN
ncbi:MAG TPA: hypothetical protein GXX20_10250 [Clostridiaceae bacterium]|nr:hypothetical protein [Clostridiaceae bacterium]